MNEPQGAPQQDGQCRIRRSESVLAGQSSPSFASLHRNGNSLAFSSFQKSAPAPQQQQQQPQQQQKPQQQQQRQQRQQQQQPLRRSKRKNPWSCLRFHKGSGHWHVLMFVIVLATLSPMIVVWTYQSAPDSHELGQISGSSSVEQVVKRNMLEEAKPSLDKPEKEEARTEEQGKMKKETTGEDDDDDEMVNKDEIHTSGWLNAKHREANANVGGLMTEEWAEAMILDYLHHDDWGPVLNATVCMAPSKFRSLQREKTVYSTMTTNPQPHLAPRGRSQQRGGGISGFVPQQPFFGADNVQNLVHQLLYLAFHDHQHSAAREEARLRRRHRTAPNENDKLPFAVHTPKAMTPFEIHHAPRSRAGSKQRHHTVYMGRQRVGVLDYQCRNAKFIVSSLPSVGLGATVRFAAVEALFLGMVTNRIGLYYNALENAPIAAMRQPWKLVSCKREDYQCFFLPLSPCVLTRADIVRAPVVRLQDIKRIYREGPGILPPEIRNARVIVAQNDVIRTKEPLGIREVLLRRVLSLYDVTMGRLRKQQKENDQLEVDGFYALPPNLPFRATPSTGNGDKSSDTTVEEGEVEGNSEDEEHDAAGNSNTTKRKALPPLPLEEQWPEVILTDLYHEDDDDTDRRLKQAIAELIRNVNRTSVHTAAYLYITRPNLYFQHRLNRTLRQILPRDYNAETAVGLPIRSSDKCLFEAECLRFEQYLSLLPHFVSKAANIRQVWGNDISEALQYDTVLFSTESHAMMEAARKRKNTKKSKRLPFRWVLNEQDVVQGTGAPRDFKTLAHMNVSAEDILFSTMLAMKLQLSASSAVMNCCSNFHALLKQYHDYGCGASSYPYVECLQENDNPRFRVCCRMTKQYNCNMRIQRGNFGRTFAQPGLDVLHPNVRQFASNSTRKKIAKALAGKSGQVVQTA